MSEETEKVNVTFKSGATRTLEGKVGIFKDIETILLSQQGEWDRCVSVDGWVLNLSNIDLVERLEE